jgi:hypothetical protein
LPFFSLKNIKNSFSKLEFQLKKSKFIFSFLSIAFFILSRIFASNFNHFNAVKSVSFSAKKTRFESLILEKSFSNFIIFKN